MDTFTLIVDSRKNRNRGTFRTWNYAIDSAKKYIRAGMCKKVIIVDSPKGEYKVTIEKN